MTCPLSEILPKYMGCLSYRISRSKLLRSITLNKYFRDLDNCWWWGHFLSQLTKIFFCPLKITVLAFASFPCSNGHSVMSVSCAAVRLHFVNPNSFHSSALQVIQCPKAISFVSLSCIQTGCLPPSQLILVQCIYTCFLYCDLLHNISSYLGVAMTVFRVTSSIAVMPSSLCVWQPYVSLDVAERLDILFSCFFGCVKSCYLL